MPDFFKGRREHIALLAGELRTPGRQVAIYGERGVGKTSLALLASFFADVSEDKTFSVRCERQSTYELVFGHLLAQSGLTYVPNGIETESQIKGAGGLGAATVSGSKSSRTRQQAISSARAIGPALLLSIFQKEPGLLIIDEYDRVKDSTTHTRLAETLKHFSDAASNTKIIVVGVAETLADLVGQHESLTRCLAQIKLGRMTDDELSQILMTGEERIGVVFQEKIRRRIIGLSDGFPFYTHLLCKYCAEEAGKALLENASARVVVSDPEYRKAIRKAIETAEGTLCDNYQAAVITVKRKTDMFKHVLWAMAYSESREVQVQEIADNIALLTGTKPPIESLSNYLGLLIKPEKQQVLTRVRPGYYKFTNPLMRAYVRLILEEYNLVEADGQMQFPWMRSPAIRDHV